MCEIAPGVYTAPRMNRAVRERIWAVLQDWFDHETDQSLLITWRDSKKVGGQRVETLGLPKHELAEHDGVFLAKRDIPDQLK